MKYLTLAAFTLFLNASYAQDLMKEVPQLEMREEIFSGLKSAPIRESEFPECGFAQPQNLNDASARLKANQASLADWINEADSLEKLSDKMIQNSADFKGLTQNLKINLNQVLTLVKGIDVSGTASAPHLGSYCATSELLLLTKNYNSSKGLVTLLSQAVESIPYKYSWGLKEKEMMTLWDLRTNAREAKEILERFQSSIQKAFNNDVNFVSFLRTKKFINRADFKSYKKHFKKVKNISHAQLKDFDKSMRKLSKQEKEEFKNLLSSQKSAYKALGHMHEARRRKILNTLIIMSNLTWGLPNTLVGVTVIAVGAIAAPFSPILDMPRFEKSESGKQIAVNVDNLFMFPSNVSFGLFQLKSNMEGADDHEGGHAVQSAILGPFYLPVVVGDYIAEGDISLNKIEDNADHNGEKLRGKLTLNELINEYYF